jgi:hypothetical protein
MEVRLRRKIVPYYQATTGSRYTDVPADVMLREMRATMAAQGRTRRRAAPRRAAWTGRPR